MVERHERLDAALEQRVEEPVVVVEAALLALPAVGKSRGQASEKRYALTPSAAISSTSSRQRR